MKLHLRRFHLGPRAVIGDLYVGDLHVFTLEAREYLIPSGTFDLLTTESGRVEAGTLWSPFPPYLPLIVVPSREGIRLHAGNIVDETVGCPLVGLEHATDLSSISRSRRALTAVMGLTGLGAHVIEISQGW